MANNRKAPRLTKKHELSKFFHPKAQQGTGMEVAEALGIVLELARECEDASNGYDINFEWHEEYSEACGVVDQLLINIAQQGEN